MLSIYKKPDAIHIFLKSTQYSICSEIPGFSASKVSLLRPGQYLDPFRRKLRQAVVLSAADVSHSFGSKRE